MILSLVFGFAVLMIFRVFGFLQQPQMEQNEPDAEPALEHTDPVVHEGDNSSAADSFPEVAVPPQPVPSSSSNPLTPESFVGWLLGRCHRRLESTRDALRIVMHRERIFILQGLQGALANPLFRASAMRNLAEMADLSDDEGSPNFRGGQPTSFGDAQRAYNFLRILRGETSGSSHVDSVADALLRGNSDESSSDEIFETSSETRRRYLESTQDQVSDPERWADLHYGEVTDDEG